VAFCLLVSLSTGTRALPHASDPDDFACSPILVNHDESAHYVGAAPSSPVTDTQHCFLCHSLRSFFSAFEKYEQRDGAPRVERLHAPPLASAARLEWSLVLGRAPPA
jgi:hypothetical protein